MRIIRGKGGGLDCLIAYEAVDPDEIHTMVNVHHWHDHGRWPGVLAVFLE